jgi:hypothetical protein
MAVNDFFPLFSTLPTELRLKIWDIDFSDPVMVGFLSYTDNMGLCQAGGQPILSPDHSSIARTCKEAWRLMTETHYRVELAAALDPSALFLRLGSTFQRRSSILDRAISVTLASPPWAL